MSSRQEQRRIRQIGVTSLIPTEPTERQNHVDSKERIWERVKLVVFDLDGTVLPIEEYGAPKEGVKDTMHDLSDAGIQLASASGRAACHCIPIWRDFGFTGPCIILGGARIVNSETGMVIWEQPLPEGSVSDITRLIHGQVREIRFDETTYSINAVLMDKLPNKASMINAIGIEDNKVEILANEIAKKIPGVGAHIAQSWIPGFQDIHIVHELATKGHGVQKLISYLGINKNDVMAVGDGNNDVSMFENVGYGVAMGNAVPALKAIANYEIPSLDEDGIVELGRKLLAARKKGK